MWDVEMFQSESEYTDEEQDYESDESHDESDGDKEAEEAEKTAPSLKKMCQDVFISRLTLKNSVEMLILADTHKSYMKPVKTAAIHCILANGMQFLKQEKLVAKLKEVPDLYFEVFATAVSEVYDLKNRLRIIHDVTSDMLGLPCGPQKT
jgi:hypothetical protein